MLASPLHEFYRLEAPEHFVRMLETGDDALLARVHMIRTAVRRIDIQTFIWANDETGRYLLAELLRAARRGVVVRLLVDQWVASLSDSITAELLAFVARAHPLLEGRLYNPVLSIEPDEIEIAGQAIWDFHALNQRMHNKLLLADGRIGITGGRNVENEYFDRGELRNYRDRDVLVVGPVVAGMQRSFDDYWRYRLSVPLDALEDVRAVLARRDAAEPGFPERLDVGDQFEELDAAASAPGPVRERLVDPGETASDVRFAADLPGKNASTGLSGGGATADALEAFVAGAERSLVMQSAYFVLDPPAARMIESLRERHRDIDVIVSTNSLASTDNLLAYALASVQRRQAIESLGIRLFELKPVPADMPELLPRHALLEARLRARRDRGEPPPTLDDNRFENDGVHLSLHAKTYVADGTRAWVGSFNLDPRSRNLNTESALIVGSPEIAGAVESEILRDAAPGNSWTIAPRAGAGAMAALADTPITALDQLGTHGLGAFSFSECFELEPGREPLPCLHPDFHARYRAAGLYPDVSQPVSDLEMALTQAVASLAEAIV